eukprot:m.126978 g.126978  ORF g.126978 m.126978 type:complete len:175 (+) comp13849_c0_seq1:179-703(+)
MGTGTTRQFVGGAVLSSLPLQVFLYFHTLLLPIWIAIYLPLHFTQPELSVQHTATVATLAVGDALRIWLGYYGNLSEQLMSLIGFTLFSLGLAPTAIVLILYFPVDPLQFGITLQVLLFIAVELVLGVLTAHRMNFTQITRFKVAYDQAWRAGTLRPNAFQHPASSGDMQLDYN